MAVAGFRGRQERLKQWKETEPKLKTAEKKVPVVYYLSRNGQLEHPHFIEVPLSSSADGLYLRDVINRLNNLRGRGMATLYCWSSKRSYNNGFVWHDLTEDDFIHPAHGHEYVLKGSELFHLDSSPRSRETTSSSSSSERSRDDSDFPLVRRKKTTWSSLDLNVYKVYKTDLTTDPAAKAATDACTQTEDRKQCCRAAPFSDKHPRTELGSDEISPPPPSSSPETLETLLPEDEDRTVGSCPRGRMRASTVLINLISCGSISAKGHGRGLSLMSQYRRRMMPRGTRDQSAKEMDGQDGLTENPSFRAICLEDKEYFSGNLIEMKQKAGDGSRELQALKRSSSCNGERSSRMEQLEKEIQQTARPKCIPRKQKSVLGKGKDSNASIADNNDEEESVLKAEIPTSQV